MENQKDMVQKQGDEGKNRRHRRHRSSSEKQKPKLTKRLETISLLLGLALVIISSIEEEMLLALLGSFFLLLSIILSDFRDRLFKDISKRFKGFVDDLKTGARKSHDRRRG